MKDLDDQNEIVKGLLEKVKDSRVVLEAQDLFWSALAGTNRQAVFRICLHSICIFAASALAFFGIGGNRIYADCSSLSEAGVVAECNKILATPTLFFIPSLFILMIGSFFSIERNQGKKFRTSALQTVLLLGGWLAFLYYLGVEGQLRVFVLITVFFSMYLGYKLTFWALFNTQR